MPRFTETEREAIQAALLEEGEKLFSAHGIKKVTVDDLAEAANISKGSFYAFYQNKEHLFMVINFRIQEHFFQVLKRELETHREMPPKELAGYVFKLLLTMAEGHPILSQIDKSTIHYIQRKLPSELFVQHTRDDVAMIEMLSEYGIVFTADSTIVAKTLQTIFGAANLLAGDQDNENIMDILIGGVLALIK